MKKITLRVLLPLVGIYLILLLLMFLGQRSLMYFPQPALPVDVAKTISPTAQIINVVAADGTNLQAYFIPPTDATYPIILAFHGNGSLGLYLAPNFKDAISRGAGVLLAEYRGYSGNDGAPTEVGLYQDADAYLNYLVTYYPDTQIFAYGQSLGSGVAVDVVSRNQQSFVGLILEAPFDSALNIADKFYPYIFFKKWILRDQYLSNQKIGTISIPKLFLLGGQDEVVGLDSGLNLFDAATDPKTIRVYDEASHMTIFQHNAQNDLIDFLESHSNLPIVP